MAITDFTPGFVTLPNESGISRLCVALGSMAEWRVPAPSVGARKSYAALQEVHCGFHAHTAAGLKIIIESIPNASSRINQQNIQGPKRVSDPVQLAIDVSRTNHITVLPGSEIHFHPRPKTPVQRDFVNRNRPLPSIHGRGEMIWRIEMRSVVRDELNALDGPRFLIRQVFVAEAREKTAQLTQRHLVVDVVNLRQIAWRIGHHTI